MLYAIGDIQGCHAEFCDLLERIDFSPRTDTLWITGDLVNRGPESLAVLREVKALGESAITVLGNHDFHLLTIAAGHHEQHRGDTLDAVLAAPDRIDLLDWLITRPLVVHEDRTLLVHAGLPPQWTPERSLALSREVEAKLASNDASRFLSVLYGDEPRRWRDDLDGDERLRVIVNACTRLRFCTSDGAMEFREKRGAAYAPAGFLPWYAQPRQSENVLIICGHWSTLGLMLTSNVAMIDTGCVWGRPLTALTLPDRRVVQVASRQPPGRL
ncbi:MAG TPA: symmetrical bis(5'-nucleosyl)-tetraphosphatase [Casimicrobiaceae bacterium]|nr:symmetrical bis(5'-nucleosyl)-tetraphosphatase [Casimicrobiaceae bacterium]